MSMQEGPERDDDMLAAELALGLLEGEALAEAESRLRADRGFAAEVAGWQERLASLAEEIDEVNPDAAQKRALLARLFPERKVSLLQRLWFWKGLSLAALVLAGLLGLALLQRPAPQEAAPLYAAQMRGEGETLELLAVLDDRAGDIALRRLAGAAPEGRVLELWAILPEQAPISLGVLPEDESMRVVLPQELRSRVGALTLAVTDEPPGGAPAGVPSGRIMAAGSVAEL
ncbi:anti-sigma factor domain-containing protein [Sulfitobacter aestuarii]|uniref:Anti-sigma factor domain-containing protein n=1 Tax=Sulfitobacter aestuarii TaxID=2161676 RepID=A0ABW5TWX3_9RHOB